MHHFACHQWSKLQTKLTTLGYFRKSQTGWLRIYFSENPTSRNFSDLSLYPKEFQKKNMLLRMGTLQKFVKPFGNYKIKSKDPWKLHEIN